MLIVLLLVTLVGSVLVTWLLPLALHSDPPYGMAVDIAAGTGAAVVWALLALLVIAPAMNLPGWQALALGSLDGIGLAAAILWVLRRIKG